VGRIRDHPELECSLRTRCDGAGTFAEVDDVGGGAERTEMKTDFAKQGEAPRDWYVVDAEGQVLGRLASQIANVLRGKNKPTFTPHADAGDFVVVINAEKIGLTGNKEDQKIYWTYSGYYGGEKGTTARKMRATHPERMLQIAVQGMLPKGSLGRQQLKKLKVYAGTTHPHTAQQPKPLKLGR
jgi:large subunit ribosomal protein L13